VIGGLESLYAALGTLLPIRVCGIFAQAITIPGVWLCLRVFFGPRPLLYECVVSMCGVLQSPAIAMAFFVLL
jgi:hypothetical protein